MHPELPSDQPINAAASPDATSARFDSDSSEGPPQKSSEIGPAPSHDLSGAPSSAAEAKPKSGNPVKVQRLHWLDLLVFAVLAALSIPGFYHHGVGDLYSDEADYALASTRGFEANRWDRSDHPREPDRLVAGRHFHAPLTVDVIALAHRFGSADQTIRLPFVIAGGLSIGMVYLCGLALFDRRREIAFGCALLVAIAPPMVRMASHALPWSLIILELLILLWTLAEYTRGWGWGWIAGCGATLGALFVTSEVFFVAIPAIATAAPFILWPVLRRPFQRRRLAWGLGLGAALFLIIAVTFWPSGLSGGAIKMLRHYMQMRHSDSFSVNVGSQIFTVAPKWSYLYWYWNDYKPFFVCYAIGVPAIVLLAAARKLHLSLIPLLSLAGFLLFAAHRAHIIGPEYLAHCLPFLTLLGGYAVYAVSLVWRPLGFAALAALAVPVARWSPRVPLPGMDARAQVSRWPAAARFLAKEWKAGDRIVVGSQPVSIAHWYLVYQGGVPPAESQFQTLPVHAPKPIFLDRLRFGFYRYVAVSNMFQDGVDLDNKTARILHGWPVAWRSEEHGTGPSRLTIYRAPDPQRVAAPGPPQPVSRSPRPPG